VTFIGTYSHIISYICDMKASVNSLLEAKIKRARPGQLFTPSDFKDVGSSAAIRKALTRLVANSSILRMSQGIYTVPKKDEVFGQILPSMEEVANAIAKREHLIIRPTGVYALNKVGLSTQIPTRLVYLTNGNTRRILIGKNTIVFKSTTSKKLSMIGKISSLLLLGLEEIDLKKLKETEMNLIRDLIMKEDPEKLRHDLKLAPSKVSDFIFKNFLMQTR